MSIIYCIRDFRFIGAPYLEALFAVLRAQPRPFYAFLAGLPKEGFLHPLRLRLPEPFRDLPGPRSVPRFFWMQKNRMPFQTSCFLFPTAGLFLLRAGHALLLDAGLLAGQVAQVVDACAAYDTDLVDLDLVDVRRVEGEDTLHAHAVRNLADREHLGLARAFDLDNHTAEALHALLVSLDDLVGDGDRVTGLERRHVGVRLGPHLLVDELDDCVFVHCCNNFCVSHSTFPLRRGYHTGPLPVIPRIGLRCV